MLNFFAPFGALKVNSVFAWTLPLNEDFSGWAGFELMACVRGICEAGIFDRCIACL